MCDYKKTVYLLILFVVIIGGCAGIRQPVRRIDYYTLEYEVPVVKKSAPLPYVIRLEKFRVSPAYDSNNIVYRESSFKRNAYVYHKWRADPGDLVTYFLARDYEYSSLFQAAYTMKSRLNPSHILEGTVDEFYEYDDADTWRAVLTVSVTLLRKMEPDVSKRVLFQRQYSETETCTQKHPSALAEAMSKAMARISQRVIADTYTHLSKAL